MSRSTRCLLAFVACLSALAITTNAETVTLDWNITWVRANPDGMAERPVMGINGQWPLPLLNFTKGDRVIANVHNQVRRHVRPSTFSNADAL
jgi:iron transport multicopper oxidase